MSRIIYHSLAIFFIVLMLTAFTALPVLAFEGRGGDTVTIAADETIEGDLYLGGRDIFIDGTVNGDVFAAGQTITITGTVNGGVSLAGQTITLRGPVHNGARLAGQTINVENKIGRDLVVFGSALSVTPASQIEGDLVLGGATATLRGTVKGDVTGGGGEVTLSGKTGGNVDIEVDKLTVTSEAGINGNLTYTGDNPATIMTGAQIGGTTTHNIPKQKVRAEASPFADVTGKVLGFFMILVIGIIIIFATGGKVRMFPDALQACTWPSLGWGAAVLFATPIAAIIVMFTVIGIPVGLISLAIWGIALYLAEIPVALLIGKLILRKEKIFEYKGLMVGALALGLVILLLLRLIPYVGWVIWLVTALFGLGTLVSAGRRCGTE